MEQEAPKGLSTARMWVVGRLHRCQEADFGALAQLRPLPKKCKELFATYLGASDLLGKGVSPKPPVGEGGEGDRTIV